MKKAVLIFLTISLFCISLLAQQPSAEEVKQVIKEERNSLASVLEEISSLSSLLERKIIAKELYKEKRVDEVKNAFSVDEERLDAYLDNNRIAEASHLLFELKVVYKSIEPLTPYLLFYEARLLTLKEEYMNAQILLEEIIDTYPDFEYLNETVILLQEIYFRQGLHREFISLYDNSTNKHNDLQSYWLAHSYYGIGDFSKAKEIFGNLQKDKNYGFRCKEMLALISLYTDGIDTAIANFHGLETKNDRRKTDYFYVPLTLARLYSVKGEIDKSLAYYDEYVGVQNNVLPDDIIFEIAVQNKNAKYYKKALKYFYVIIDKPTKSDYYSSARLLATLTEQERGDFSNIKSGLNEVILNNTVLERTLKAKYKLLEKYDNLKEKLKQEEFTVEQKKEFNKKLDSIESILANTNKTLANLYSGKDPSDVAILQAVEEEYLYYNVTIDMMDAVIDLANTIPNKRIPRLIDRKISFDDSSKTTIKMLKYLGHKKNITAQDIKIAKALIEEKDFENELLSVWNKVYKFANEKGKEKAKVLASKSILLVQDNLTTLDKVAEQAFNGSPSPEFENILNQELAGIEKNKTELRSLRKVVVEKFNKRIAKRLESQKEVIKNEDIHLKDFYDKVLGKVLKDVNNEKTRNQFTLLDILYKQSKALDAEYEQEK